MTKKAILPKLFVAILLIGVFAFLGCEGSNDQSLTINAFAPINQSTTTVSVMDNIFKVRLGVFERSLNDYNYNTYYKLDNIVKDYLTCTTTQDATGNWSELSCERCTDGSCNSASPDDDVLNKIRSCKETGTVCEATHILDDTRINVLELPDLPGGADPFVYTVEGFGDLTVVSTTACTKQQECETGWDCQNGELYNLFNLNTCVRTIDGGVVARGVSAPTTYDGDHSDSVDVMFGLTTKVGMLSTSDGKLVETNYPRTGHKAVGLPDGKVLIIGGETVSGSQKVFPNSAELYDPYQNSFEDLTIAGWTGGRSNFTLNEIADATPLSNITEVKFVIIGGQSSQGMYNEVMLGTYNLEERTLSFVAMPSLNTPVKNHTATTLNDGRILIVGGLSSNAAVTDSYVLDVEKQTLTPTSGQLKVARYGHTATLMPSGRVVIVGGKQNDGYTCDQVEVYVPETDSFTTYEYEDTASSVIAETTSRFGHIAIPIAEYNADGSVSEENYATARVAIYGGYRYMEQDKDNNQQIHYYNAFSSTSANEVIVAFVDQDGKVTSYTWGPNEGYEKYMEFKGSTNHPTVESEWKFIGDSKDTVLVVGGRSNNSQDFSSWVEVIRFVPDTNGYQFGKFRFGPDESTDIVATPFRSALMGASEKSSVGRYGMSLAKLPSGNIMITGGSINSNGVIQSIKTSEVYFTPSHNTWGGQPKLISDF